MLNIMKNQAGRRPVYAMTNGNLVLTTHYDSYEEFLLRLAEKNGDVELWGGNKWSEVIK